MKRALIGMSGGIDSTVAAKLLLDKGYDVKGLYLKLFSSDAQNKMENTQNPCSPTNKLHDAKKSASRLGIELLEVSSEENFEQKVINPFIASYLEGKTPNPCIECNRKIKFSSLLNYAQSFNCDHIATGHYARVLFNTRTGRWELLKARDLIKDQSYFLASLKQEQLEKVLFPLGDLTKDEVRKIGENFGLIKAKEKESQDICFIPSGKYGDFIESYSSDNIEPGDYLDIDGRVIGKHKGVAHYTIGQRRGIGIALGVPSYVIAKDAKNNTVTIGSEENLYTKELLAKDINFIAIEKLAKPLSVSAKIRYSHIGASAKIYNEKIDGKSFVKVVFDKAQRAVTPGQAVVFYIDEKVIGGGTIT